MRSGYWWRLPRRDYRRRLARRGDWRGASSGSDSRGVATGGDLRGAATGGLTGVLTSPGNRQDEYKDRPIERLMRRKQRKEQTVQH